MREWLKNEIAKCEVQMSAAAAMHNLTEYAKLAERKKALQECLSRS
jgi:hypothetical protein